MTTTVPDLRPVEVCAPRLLAGWFATGAAADHAAHVARYGPCPWPTSGIAPVGQS